MERIERMFSQIFSKIRKASSTMIEARIVYVGPTLAGSVKVVQDELGIDLVEIMNKVYVKELGTGRSEFKIGRSDINGLVEIGKTIMKTIREFRKNGRLESFLFVIPSNPETLLGNGNGVNKSPEGIFGRASAMSVIGWTVTNPSIRFINVPISGRRLETEID